MSQMQSNDYYNGAAAAAASHEYAHPMFAVDAAKEERISFIQRTYLHLGGAILLFAALEAIVINFVAPAIGVTTIIGWFGGYNMLFVLGAFLGVSFLAQKWAISGASRGVQYAGLGLYIIAETILFLPLLLIASTFFEGAIMTAGIASVGIFGGLTVFTMVTKADFSFMRSILVTAVFAALACIVASIVLGMSLGIWFTGAMILLAAGFILYDTSNVMHHYRTDQHVAASLALFSSIALLFWYVLQLVMFADE